ncbi:type I-C CRISPR-associated protein Cas8c/Csd1 [Frankia sp. AiPs1]|uniref:type I-C CRISPR-associated protein Cas8c/Csd1 n=1 Tax=Frankia sp. AiPs1 TaxID=573493 RepID=UPI002043FFC0|nr:type I-C CRISPR-associated protein Cas8c/Csd1 [Frankia sp. AiPs1]MCM3922082.1 type I-C CRISPR-associated protein Cas8c/Csd1 [Frankia sp. AiPs1]
MLLQRLVAYEPPSIPGFEDAALPPFFRERPMRWGLRITPDGRLRSPHLIDLANPADRQAKFGQPGPAPYLARSSGFSPLLGADGIKYVLGWTDDKSEPEKFAGYHAASIALVAAWAASASADPVAQACARFFTDGHHHAVLQPESWKSTDSVVLLVGADGHWVTEEPTLRAFWAREVQRRKAGGQAKNRAGRSGICLVCGQSGVLVDRFPLQLPQRLVPGCNQPSGAALVSANKTIHTYDFTKNLTVVPICLGCAQRSVANLEYLLDDSSHALACGDSRMTWWTIGRDFDLHHTVEKPDPQQIVDMVNRVHHGAGAVPVEDPDRFCSLTISGNTSRVMIRDWIDMPLTDLEANLTAWFADHQMHGISNDRGGYLPLVRLELATGRWIATRGGDGQSGEYARFEARNAQRPDGVRRQLLQTAVKGVALPPAVFSHLLTRIRTDGHVDDPRAALLRLALVRRARHHPTDGRSLFVPGPGLDPDSHDPAYVAGRIFAQLETIQYYAARVGRGKEDRLNATFADRHLAGAIANPTIALIEGQKLAQPWLKKIGRGQPGVAVNLRRQLSDLFDLLDGAAGLPGRAQLDEQARFILGYHHHRADSIRRGMAANAAKTSTPSPAGAPASADTAADDSIV